MAQSTLEGDNVTLTEKQSEQIRLMVPNVIGGGQGALQTDQRKKEQH